MDGGRCPYCCRPLTDGECAVHGWVDGDPDIKTERASKRKLHPSISKLKEKDKK